MGIVKPPLRVAIVGIDGSGKSSTTLRGIQLLGQLLGNERTILKPGRDAFVVRGGVVTYMTPRLSRFFERLFRRADATRRRSWIGLSRILFVLAQGIVEPALIRRCRPDLVLSTRCMVLDPAVYAGVYFPWLDRRLSLAHRLRAARLASRLPCRDVYILLRTPPREAMGRIHRRISRDHGREPLPREYWLHLHEEEATLARLGRRFDEALGEARKLAAIEVIEIDTSASGEEAVAQRIANEVLARLAIRERRND